MQQAVQAQIIQGDALDVLRTLPAGSVQCVVTSPPYFGLRDYGTAEWDGGEDGCDHTAMRRNHADHEKQATSAGTSRDRIVGTDCRRCGATRIDRQIGLESTPAEYVTKMVAVFREVRRVLRKDGVAWVNMGDSYVGGGRGGNPAESTFRKQATNVGSLVAPSPIPDGLKPKDLCGMPWRLAFALQADGWYLRQDIIWAKPNPMPESVTDRCTKAHEYIFLLSKSERYFYDAEAIAEPHATGYRTDKWAATVARTGPKTLQSGGTSSLGNLKSEQRNKRSVWTIITEPYPDAHFATFPTELPRICILAGTPSASCAKCGKPIGERNEDLPDVQHSIQSEDFRQRQTPSGNGDILQSSVREQGGRQKKVGQGLLPNDQGIHPDLFAATSKYLDARLCDGTSDSHGASVGEAIDIRRSGASPQRNQKRQPADEPGASDEGSARSFAEIAAQADSMPALRRIDKDVRACAACGADLNAAGATSPAVVLDPFAGSGTTLQVALELSRAAIGIELNADYVALANRRLNGTTLGLPLEIAA